MSFLDMLSHEERRNIRINLFATEEFFAAVQDAIFGVNKETRTRLFDTRLDAAFERNHVMRSAIPPGTLLIDATVRRGLYAEWHAIANTLENAIGTYADDDVAKLPLQSLVDRIRKAAARFSPLGS